MAEMVFSCPHCGQPVQCDSQYAGQTVACPHCQGGIIVPAEEPAPAPEAPAEVPQEESAPQAQETPAAEPDAEELGAAEDDEVVVTFNCPGCGEELEIPESMFGDRVGCPDCKMDVTESVPLPKPSTGEKKIVMKKKTIKPLR